MRSRITRCTRTTTAAICAGITAVFIMLSLGGNMGMVASGPGSQPVVQHAPTVQIDPAGGGNPWG